MDIPAENDLVPERPEWREPTRIDYLRFFVGVPVAVGVFFSLVGTRLTTQMPYFAALVYMVLHMFVVWWMVSGAAFALRHWCRSWRPPVFAIVVMAYVSTLVPAALVYQQLGELFGNWYPVFAANRSDVAPSWSLTYLAHFLRFSIPGLPLYLAGIYGYRALQQIDWLGYPPEPESAAVPAAESKASRSETLPLASKLAGTELPADAIVISVKAEQHYIQIWTDQGKELLRYRFKDVRQALKDCDGDQVHRSWWVNFDHMRRVRKSGRSIELEMSHDITVPVSLANRNTVVNALEEKMQ
ncbi:MAG: LytTR family transcriptional regulator [Gammaproteobacteria bacterium]|nr:LytTR family transcriptional regulator [Gammaproteobacteria bacterium]